MEHSPTGPSALDNIRQCLGWVGGTADDKDSEQGSALDAAITRALRGEAPIAADVEHSDTVAWALDQVAQLKEANGSKCTMLVQHRVKYVVGGHEDFGTLDVALIWPRSDLVIIPDWKLNSRKDGDCMQLLAYMAGIANEFPGIRHFQGLICNLALRQTRRGQLHSRSSIAAAMAEAGAMLVRRAGATEADYRPEPRACKYCARAPQCPALAKAAEPATAIVPNVSEPASAYLPAHPVSINAEVIRSLPPIELAKLIHKLHRPLELANVLLGVAKSQAFALLSEGIAVPGLTLADTRAGNREWINNDADKVAAAVQSIAPVDRDKLIERTPVSVAKAQKAIEAAVNAEGLKRQDGSDKKKLLLARLETLTTRKPSGKKIELTELPENHQGVASSQHTAGLDHDPFNPDESNA